MADKLTCPGCGAHTSSVLRAVSEGESCPHCGLSADAIMEIIEIRSKRADAALKDRAAEAVKQAAKWRRAALIAEWRLDQIREALVAEIPDWLERHGRDNPEETP